MAEPQATDWEDLQMWGTGDLARFLGGSESSFTGLLLVLIAKADPVNKARLRAAFPWEVAAYDQWQSMSPVPTFAQLRSAMKGAPGE